MSLLLKASLNERTLCHILRHSSKHIKGYLLGRRTTLLTSRFEAFSDFKNLMSTEASKKSNAAPAVPRPSASLIVVNDKNEVLMVQRNPDSRSFAGAHVFPGGNYDSKQDFSLQMTALRETFEETGVLLASRRSNLKDSPQALNESILEQARKSIHAGKQTFTDFLSRHGLEPDVGSLLTFTEWITPPPVPRRFHTRFFVIFLPTASAIAGHTSGTHYHRLPTPDSPDASSGHGTGTEVLSAKYIHPRDALDANARGEMPFMPPQCYLLTTLNEIFGTGKDSRVSTTEQREKIQRLADGYFGRLIFNPRWAPNKDSTQNDQRLLTFEGDETRGGKKGVLHRVAIIQEKGPVPKRITLIRNFDVFSIDDTLIPSTRL